MHEALDEALPSLLSAPLWAVGFSGGRDSTVLLHALWRWCSAHSAAPPLHALHVNHNLHPDASAWAAHCKTVCDEWCLPFECLPVTVPEQASPEAAARDARYAALEAALPEGAVLFLAHHLDDQVETFFLRLLRGAGLDGLSSMPMSRPLGHAQLYRPLLQVDAARIRAYAQAHGLSFVDDDSNADTGIDRNYLRHNVLPQLEVRWPAYRQTVARAVGHVSRARDTLHENLGIVPTQVNVMGDQGIALRYLLGETAVHHLRAWLQQRGLLAPGESAVNEFLRQLREGGEGSRPVLNTGRYTLQRYRDAVYLVPAFNPEPAGDCRLGVTEVAELPDIGRFTLGATHASGLALGDTDVLRLTWATRPQRVSQVGRGGTQALKAVFQDLGVPPWWRSRIPLLYLGDELLAVGDRIYCKSSRWAEQAEGGETLWRLGWERPGLPML